LRRSRDRSGAPAVGARVPVSTVAALRAVLAVAVLALLFSARAALAHGGATIDRDPCVQKTGNWSVHFTVYQPDLDPAGEYCADVPKAGPMIVVFDLVDVELRTIPIDLQVVKLEGNSPQPVRHVAAKPYPNGVVNAEFSVDAPGRYAAILTLDGRPPVVFPMRVEMRMPVWLWLVPLVLVAPILYYWSQRRTPPPSTAEDARRNMALVK
jgi:hypothetical protein